jgi:hypothetical protein
MYGSSGGPSGTSVNCLLSGAPYPYPNRPRGARARLARGAVRQQRRPQRHQRKALAQRHALQVHHARLHRSERLPPAAAPPVRRGAVARCSAPHWSTLALPRMRFKAVCMQGMFLADKPVPCRQARKQTILGSLTPAPSHRANAGAFLSCWGRVLTAHPACRRCAAREPCTGAPAGKSGARTPRWARRRGSS